MKKRNITLCAVAMLCMQGYAKADTFTLKGDNTCVENYAQMTAAYKSNRPKMKKRLFTSKAVEAEILRVKKLLTNPKLAWMFENCFPNTLDTTVHFRMLDGKPDTFVYTGDIHAMWLRDSGAQVWPYVQLANNDAQLKEMLEGVIRRQFLCINIDPYANAFNDGPTGGNWMTDLTALQAGERFRPHAQFRAHKGAALLFETRRYRRPGQRKLRCHCRRKGENCRPDPERYCKGGEVFQSRQPHGSREYDHPAPHQPGNKGNRRHAPRC